MREIIFQNYDSDDLFECEKERLTEELGEEPSDERVWDLVYYDEEYSFKQNYLELLNFFEGKKIIIFGTVGRWDYDYRGGAIGEFDKLFNDAIEDCRYVEISDDNGHLYLKCSHHDGTNYFEIKELTDKGYNYSENWYYDYSEKYHYYEEEMHNRIIKCSFLSRLPHFCEYLEKEYQDW